VILVCGDFMLDRWQFGEVTRISPEAPCPVISIKREETRDGAAANVAANVRSLGVPCRTEYGDQENDIVKTRLMARGQQIMRVDNDYPQKPIMSLDLTSVRIVIFVDYGKGTLDYVGSLIKDAKAAGCTVLVDPKGYDYERYRGADVIKPNLDEMKVMVGGWKDEFDLREKAQALCRTAGISALLLTRAADGMSLYRESSATYMPSVAEQVVDVAGAGESAIAALGVGLHRGYSIEQATVFANTAAGIAVGKFGPSVVTQEEIEARRFD
jgi:D-glycero-beta-D-manno-heptose-7-phosphate kinase